MERKTNFSPQKPHLNLYMQGKGPLQSPVRLYIKSRPKVAPFNILVSLSRGVSCFDWLISEKRKYHNHLMTGNCEGVSCLPPVLGRRRNLTSDSVAKNSSIYFCYINGLVRLHCSIYSLWSITLMTRSFGYKYGISLWRLELLVPVLF